MNRTQIRIIECDHPAGDPRRGAPYGERCDPTTLTASAVLPYIIGGVGATVLSGALSDKGTAPAAPTVAAPTVMPTPDDAAVKKAQAAQLSTLQTRRGRQSTILDNSSGDLLGA